MNNSRRYKTVEEVVKIFVMNPSYVGAWIGEYKGQEYLLLSSNRRINGKPVTDIFCHSSVPWLSGYLVVDGKIKDHKFSAGGTCIEKLAKMHGVLHILSEKNLIEEARKI